MCVCGGEWVQFSGFKEEVTKLKPASKEQQDLRQRWSCGGEGGGRGNYNTRQTGPEG